ncbi:MAG: hypothetical protein HUK08_01040 [Bacteroidaceae bacterium]|nr:hypothetical protein [Bacteroidaceae bacterium]
MNRTLFAIFSIVAAIAFSSCTKADGDWDDIEVTVNGQYCESETLDVPAEGGVYVISSRNYGALWILKIQESAGKVWPEKYDWSDWRNIDLTTDWYNVKCNASGEAVVTIKPKAKDAADSRMLAFEFEYGDVFTWFALIQK